MIKTAYPFVGRSWLWAGAGAGSWVHDYNSVPDTARPSDTQYSELPEWDSISISRSESIFFIRLLICPTVIRGAISAPISKDVILWGSYMILSM